MSVSTANKRWNDRLKAARKNYQDAKKLVPIKDRKKMPSFDKTEKYRQLEKGKRKAIYYETHKQQINERRRVTEKAKREAPELDEISDDNVLETFSSKSGKLLEAAIKQKNYKTFLGIVEFDGKTQTFTDYSKYQMRINKILSGIFKLNSAELLSYQVKRALDFDKKTLHLIAYTKIYIDDE